MTKDLIDLQHAHVTQHTRSGNKGPWEVRKNRTKNLLHKLPAHLSEADVFAALDFARAFELLALNAGIAFQKRHQDKALTSRVAELERNITLAREENERLAAKLETLIGDKG